LSDFELFSFSSLFLLLLLDLFLDFFDDDGAGDAALVPLLAVVCLFLLSVGWGNCGAFISSLVFNGVTVCLFSLGDESVVAALALVLCLLGVFVSGWCCFLCLDGVFERERDRVRDLERDLDRFLERLSLLLDFLCFFLDILYVYTIFNIIF
jgi:hypothetical protein